MIDYFINSVRENIGTHLGGLHLLFVHTLLPLCRFLDLDALLLLLSLAQLRLDIFEWFRVQVRMRMTYDGSVLG